MKEGYEWRAMIQNRPGWATWQIYFYRKLPDRKIEVIQPVKIEKKIINSGEVIPEPTFDLSYELNTDIEEIIDAIIEAGIYQSPRLEKKLQERFAVKVNADEIQAYKEHIENLNKIIQSMNPYKDVREK